jgi:ketosteroid isomerase-like protein
MTHAVTEANKAIREFFEAYAKATKSLDLAFLGSAYGDTFMFAGPGGVQAVKRDDFLKVIPKRGAFFKAAGLMTTEVRRLEEIRLDETHTMVRSYWSMRFEKGSGHPIIEEIAATYILRREQEAWRIVFQLDHQDLTKRVQELGLVPPSD